MSKKSRLADYTDQELRDLGVAGIEHLYASKNSAWNALFLPGSGRLAGEKPENSDTGERKPRSNGGKRKGCFPAKLDASLNKALGCQDDDSPDWIADPVWADFTRARALQGQDWVSFISKKIKDKELVEFELWVSSNDAADKAESAVSAAMQKRLDEAVELLSANGYTVIMPS